MAELIGLGFLAGVLPVYFGIVFAMVLGRTGSRTSEGFILGLTIGILVYLFFDLMHEAVEFTGVRDGVSWLVAQWHGRVRHCRGRRQSFSFMDRCSLARLDCWSAHMSWSGAQRL